MQYLIDTGSSANVVDQRTFESWKQGDARFSDQAWLEPGDSWLQFAIKSMLEVGKKSQVNAIVGPGDVRHGHMVTRNSSFFKFWSA